MAVESGRPNEFADDAHFWPEDAVKDSIFWKAGPAKNERMATASATDKYMLYITDFNGKQIQIPVKLRKEND